MQAYIIRRLIQGLGVLLVMSFVIYGLIGLMPGDPIDMMIQADPNLSTADAARLRALHGLDRPIVERYWTWLGAALAGDFGYSRQFARPVLDVLLPRLGNTLLLMGVSFVLAIAIALPLGVAAARRPRSLADQAINLLCFAGISVPAFWLALLLIMLFAVTLGVLPAGGMAPAGMQNPGLLDRLPYLVLPVLTLTLASVAGLTRFLRASLIEAMREDYIRTARAKGAGETRVLWRHGLRNALIPVVTVMALDFGTLFSGALITETMFAYAGMGKLIYDAIMNNDYNLALVGLLFATLVTLTANLAADILYARLDPRISYR
ncbi:MAG: ABC transporter permease [Alphaproteobacteria bacterium]|nr:ABC transporter permease [Alphaproteobacteria bacterium]MBU0797818.1 ABC transporter permease [Alphaproteobacteria bacterium]MBU0885861.1 ABC transporter permease [Alphaproteobacteria bacterium]MBU1814590.1 ABC transporter permease [Alphaproteobacteria bacterium]MBU2089500.1 ABC transporter permease [Alphaproteobacteria bacterium]